MRKPLPITILLPFLLCLVVSCNFLQEHVGGSTEQKAAVKEPASATETSTAKEPKKSSVVSSQPANRQKITRLLADDQYLEALAVIRQSSHEGATEREFGGAYRETLIGLVKQADALLDAEDYGSAGLRYRALLENFPGDRESAGNNLPSVGQVTSRIDLCAEKLMEQGLASYRSGQLQDAIATWQKILVFCPQHQAGLNAIQTARTQLSNLQKLNANDQ